MNLAQCGHCHNQLRFSNAHVGKTIKCPNCSKSVELPAVAVAKPIEPGQPSSPDVQAQVDAVPEEEELGFAEPLESEQERAKKQADINPLKKELELEVEDEFDDDSGELPNLAPLENHQRRNPYGDGLNFGGPAQPTSDLFSGMSDPYSNPQNLPLQPLDPNAGPIPTQPPPGQPVAGQPYSGQESPPHTTPVPVQPLPLQPLPGTTPPTNAGPQSQTPNIPVQPGLAPPVPIPVTPVQGTPVQGTPVQGTPVQGTPVQGTPVQGTPVQGTPVQGTPVQGTPVQGTPVQGTPVQGTPVQGTPVQGTPVQGTPVQGTPVQGTPVQGTPVQGTPVQGTPVQGTPVQGTPVQGTPVQGTPVQGTPVQGTPVQGTPVQGTPVQGTPVQGTPVQGTPVQGTPVQGTPVQGTPVQGTPVPGTPVPGTPVPGTPVPGTPVPGTPVQGTPVPVTPVQGTPVQAIPVKAIPVPVTPVQSAPGQIGPTQTNPTPIRATPVQANPVQPTPSQPTVQHPPNTQKKTEKLASQATPKSKAKTAQTTTQPGSEKVTSKSPTPIDQPASPALPESAKTKTGQPALKPKSRTEPAKGKKKPAEQSRVDSVQHKSPSGPSKDEITSGSSDTQPKNSVSKVVADTIPFSPALPQPEEIPQANESAASKARDKTATVASTIQAQKKNQVNVASIGAKQAHLAAPVPHNDSLEEKKQSEKKQSEKKEGSLAESPSDAKTEVSSDLAKKPHPPQSLQSPQVKLNQAETRPTSRRPSAPVSHQQDVSPLPDSKADAPGEVPSTTNTGIETTNTNNAEAKQNPKNVPEALTAAELNKGTPGVPQAIPVPKQSPDVQSTGLPVATPIAAEQMQSNPIPVAQAVAPQDHVNAALPVAQVIPASEPVPQNKKAPSAGAPLKLATTASDGQKLKQKEYGPSQTNPQKSLALKYGLIYGGAATGVLVVVIVALLLVQKTLSGGPTETFRKVKTALLEDDFGAVYQLVDDDTQHTLDLTANQLRRKMNHGSNLKGQEKYAEIARLSRDQLNQVERQEIENKKELLRQAKVKNQRVNGSKATLTIEFGDAELEYLELRKIDGDWRLGIKSFSRLFFH